MTNPARPDDPAADPRHLLVIGAGPAPAVLSRTGSHKAATTSRSWPGTPTGWPNWPAT